VTAADCSDLALLEHAAAGAARRLSPATSRRQAPGVLRTGATARNPNSVRFAGKRSEVCNLGVYPKKWDSRQVGAQHGLACAQHGHILAGESPAITLKGGKM